MKRRFTINVDIDTDSTGGSYCKSGLLNNKFDVVVTNSDTLKVTPKNLPTIIAHEVGHAIGAALNLPGASKEIRGRYHDLYEKFTDMLSVFMGWFYPYILESEEEAWEIAAPVYSAFIETKNHCLGTYNKEIDFEHNPT